MTEFHTSVLLQEAIASLNISEGKRYIDATLGGGGHTRAILEKGGQVLGIDQDEEAIEHVRVEFKIQNSKFKVGKELILMYGNFKDIREIAEKNGFGKVDGILFDIGISSHHVDTPERGFSFQTDAPLDMRMDRSLGVTAADLINGLWREELISLFMKLGEEYRAKKNNGSNNTRERS